MRFVVIGCLCGGALAAVGCAEGRGVPTGPSATAAVAAGAPSLSASPRSGELHVTKECGDYLGNAGDFCTITSSNVKAIEVGCAGGRAGPHKAHSVNHGREDTR